MSSFVIGKEEFIKAAGLSAGIAKGTDIYFYDSETGRTLTTADYYQKFVNIFEMNALSVQEQYNDKESYNDYKTYEKSFDMYYKKGLKVTTTNRIMDAVGELNYFFRGVLYQIEKPSYYWKAKNFFDTLIIKLFEKAYPVESENWGSFDFE